MAVGIDIKGREVLLTIAGQSILGLTDKGATVNNEMVDVTDDAANGWRLLAAVPGLKTVDIPFSGIFKNLEMLRAIMTAGSQIYDATLTYPDGSTITGDFGLENFSHTGSSNEAQTFDVNLVSSGEVTFTAGVGGS
jgi:predicted secreted protein